MNPMISNIKAVLFDLGNVLVELDGPPIKPEWLDSSVTPEESWRRWNSSLLVEEYEKGRISAREFIEGIIREQGIHIDADSFVEHYVHWPKALFPGVLDLLAGLRSRLTVALYSNTSDLHWPRLMDEMQLDGKFDHYFASFQIGMYKPDVESFAYVAGKMGLEPSSILFLDDNPANVAGARHAGLVSEQVKGIDQVKNALSRYALIKTRKK